MRNSPGWHRHQPQAGRALPAYLRLALAIGLSSLLGACAVVDFEQRRWIFQPTDEAWGPGVTAAQGMSEVWIDFVSAHPEHTDAAVRLHALWLPQTDTRAPVLLFLHGVRWDVRASAPRMRQLHALGFSVLGIDYRGFGRSSQAQEARASSATRVSEGKAWLLRPKPR